MKINEWLSAQIKTSGKTQFEIAKAIGIDNEQLSRWARGEHEPTGFFVDVLLTYFGQEIRIDGKPYRLDELGRYVAERKDKTGIYYTEISKKLGKYKDYVVILTREGRFNRFSKFEEVVKAYGGKVEICEKDRFDKNF